MGRSGSSLGYITGSIAQVNDFSRPDRIEELYAESIWERMYVNPKPVIIVCGFCKAHNVVTSPCCIQCGAPMGAGVERQYG